jgi:Rrf2 family iron-sulfur cluster assembly transcriptional regulator
MRLTRQTVYGLGCLLEIAKIKNRPVTIGEISRLKGISKDYVEQILIRLKKKNLIKSVRGLKGGYILARKPRLITLRDVIEAQELKVLDIFCLREDNLECSYRGCRIKSVWINIKERIEGLLDKIKISGLLKTEKSK